MDPSETTNLSDTDFAAHMREMRGEPRALPPAPFVCTVWAEVKIPGAGEPYMLTANVIARNCGGGPSGRLWLRDTSIGILQEIDIDTEDEEWRLMGLRTMAHPRRHEEGTIELCSSGLIIQPGPTQLLTAERVP